MCCFNLILILRLYLIKSVNFILRGIQMVEFVLGILEFYFFLIFGS